MQSKEVRILETLEASIRSNASSLDLDEILVRLARALVGRPDDNMARATLAPERFSPPLPTEIRSAWIFTLRACVRRGSQNPVLSLDRTC